MIGKTLSHYRIVEKIGAGGMGEVYRAHDERLERDVALKVLPTGTLADEAARKRFRKEALALSKLNHPNIQTVFDFDTQDGVDFLVTEYVPGLTVSDKLTAGALPEKEVARLGAQLADGLAAAQKENIVHRDLKPANLRLTPEGRLKILDFGLAKLVRPVGETTTEGTTESATTQSVVGTLPYMAPEQLRGEPVDARSDLYAAGVVLYEMATGRRPFEDKLATALAENILHTPPPPPGRFKPELSTRLEEIILKCLEKDPESRYQSAKELLVDLRRVGKGTSTTAPAPWQVPRGSARWVWRVAGVVLAVVALVAMLVGLNVGGLRERLLGRAAPGQITSIAVLPLENMMGDSEQDYFVEGMHDALITELSKIGALKVISRTSAMRYKGSDKSLPEIARELGVDAVLEGSVLRVGERVRVAAQLIHAATDEHLWADNFDRELNDILALHSEVARAVAREIRIAVTPEEEARLARVRRVDPEAHETYLKGRYYSSGVTVEGLEKSIDYFQQAIAKDPTYALAYVGLARAYRGIASSRAFGLENHSKIPPTEAWAKARAAATRALQLDETLAEAHAELGSILLETDWNWTEAEKEFKRALELNPNHSDIHTRYGRYLRAVGRTEEALKERIRALELDPLEMNRIRGVGVQYIFARRFDEAAEYLRKALALNPDDFVLHFWLTYAYEGKGLYEEAAAERVKRLTLQQEVELADMFMRIYEKEGYQAAVTFLDQNIVDEELKRPRRDSYLLAYTYARLGEKDKAFQWLEQAYEERSMHLIRVRVDADFDSIRDDPRFQDLLRRMNFPE